MVTTTTRYGRYGDYIKHLPVERRDEARDVRDHEAEDERAHLSTGGEWAVSGQ